MNEFDPTSEEGSMLRRAFSEFSDDDTADESKVEVYLQDGIAMLQGCELSDMYQQDLGDPSQSAISITPEELVAPLPDDMPNPNQITGSSGGRKSPFGRRGH